MSRLAQTELPEGRNHERPRLAGSAVSYVTTLLALLLALALPIGLMIFNPTLMFQRGWEQYVGTAIYCAALFMLARELMNLWGNERAFREIRPDCSTPIAPSDQRWLAARVRHLQAQTEVAPPPTGTQLIELNRETSALDQEHVAGRFTITRYILYLLPVIGFIGTVEGISKALVNMSVVLSELKNLDVFLQKLQYVTSALQIAFDSTLLALFLSAALMLAQTLVYRRAEDLLGRVDRWIVEYALPSLGRERDPAGELALALTPLADLGQVVERFELAVERLLPAVSCLERGSVTLGRLGDDLLPMKQAIETARQSLDTLERIDRGMDRAGEGIESLSQTWTLAFEKNSKATQEHLARTLENLKDALELLNVSMEQSNSLYRNIVRKLFEERVAA